MKDYSKYSICVTKPLSFADIVPVIADYEKTETGFIVIKYQIRVKYYPGDRYELWRCVDQSDTIHALSWVALITPHDHDPDSVVMEKKYDEEVIPMTNLVCTKNSAAEKFGVSYSWLRNHYNDPFFPKKIGKVICARGKKADAYMMSDMEDFLNIANGFVL